MFKKVLVAVDGSDSSQGAIKLVKGLAQGGLVEAVTLISVTPAPSLTLQAMDFIVSETNRIDPLSNLVVENTRSSLESIGLKVDTVVLSGDPSTKICKYAKDHQFDLIILGSRGLSTAKELVLGSVSHKVLQMAPCPVLIFRA
jgi:nucleotide-binding universal stress UspA family protein